MTTKSGTIVPVKKKEKKHHSFWVDLLLRLFKQKPLGTVGLGIVLLLLVVGVFAKFIAPYGMNDIHLVDKLQGPSSTYLLGTDQLGRDILSRLIYGAQISVEIGLGATALSQIISILIGVTSGYVGGKVDLFVMRFVDVWMCIPPFVVLMIVASLLGHGVPILILIIGITGGIGGSRVMRSAVIGIKSNMYISASDAIGCGPIRTMWSHILPNVTAVIIIGFTMGVGGAILQEASLSFLGLGVAPGVPSWGSMLSQEGRQYMEAAPALALWPGLFLTIVVWGANQFGDALRDLLDPRLRGGVGRYSLSEKRLQQIRQATSSK
jgi:peptide/nickel transport system permease protein